MTQAVGVLGCVFGLLRELDADVLHGYICTASTEVAKPPYTNLIFSDSWAKQWLSDSKALIGCPADTILGNVPVSRELYVSIFVSKAKRSLCGCAAVGYRKRG